MNDVTQILHAAARGDPKAPHELLPLVYQELRRVAAHKMALEAPGHTLQPTALVHEAWLRLVPGPQPQLFEGRAHFFGASAEMVKLCFFVGLTQEQAAQELGVSLATAERVWGFARSWLLREVRKQKTGTSGRPP